MAIAQQTIGSHVAIYDITTNKLLSFESIDDYNKRKDIATKLVLSHRDEFKQRGFKVIKTRYTSLWDQLVDNALANHDTAWYNGVSLEAALICMERLSSGASVEDSYQAIDVQSSDSPCIYLGMELSGWQNHSVSEVVGSYHERGQEFCNYRNNFVKEKVYKI